MPKFAVRRPVAIAAVNAMVAASAAVLLVSSVAAPPAGAAAAPGSTLRASVQDQTNAQAPTGGRDSVISADGNSIAFVSNSKLDNLDPGRGEGGVYDNVYVRDLVRNRTVMISRGQFTRSYPTVDNQPPQIRLRSENLLDLNAARLDVPVTEDTPPDDNSYSPSISADGRYVSFLTEMTNLFREDPYSDDEIVVADRDPDNDGDYDENREDGSRDYRYLRIAQSSEDIGSYEYARQLKMDANATRLVWIEGEGDSMLRTVALKLPTGQVGLPDEVPAGPDNTNNDVVYQFDPAISADGNHIAMRAVVDIGGGGDDCDCWINVIVSTDIRTRETTRVDIDAGQPVSTEYEEFVMRPAISADGSVIAFVAEKFVDAGEGGFVSDFDEPTVYVVNVDYTRPPDQRVVRSTIASRDNKNNLINGDLPALSSDGRYLAFVTDALGTHDGADGNTTNGSCIMPPAPSVPRMAGEPLLDLNAADLPPRRNAARTNCQVVVRDLIVDRERLVTEQSRLAGTLASANRSGNAGNGNTVPSRQSGVSCPGYWPPCEPTPPSLSADGRRIGFDSNASDLVAEDTNRSRDVFVRTFEPTMRAEAVNFGEVEVGQVLVRSARIDQVGAGPLAIESVTIDGPNAEDFTILGQTCQGTTLHQTGNCRVTVEFGPKATGDRSARLVVRARGARPFTVDLLGSGTERPVPPEPRGPEFSVDPSPLNFGDRLVRSPAEQTVTITNRGEQPLRISSVSPVGPGTPADYAVSANTCAGVDVPAAGQCRVTVKFTPGEPGNRPAVLQFADNAVGSPHLVDMRGSAGPLSIQVNPAVSPPGRATTVTGKGYPPGHTVTVKFDQRVGQAKATVDANGNFSTSLVVFPKASPETRTIVATVDVAPNLFATTTMLIVIPSVNPADFVVRG